MNSIFNPLYTNKGSKIWYSKFDVGKQMGSKIYMHKDYALEIIPTDVWNDAQDILHNYEPSFEFNCVCYDLKNPNIIRFDEALNFNTAREPQVGTMIIVGTALRGEKSYKIFQSNMCWHHKWLWVLPDYQGFNVQESYDWSKLWLSKLEEPANGSRPIWNKQLAKYGLT